jgi:hypothetical protein
MTQCHVCQQQGGFPLPGSTWSDRAIFCLDRRRPRRGKRLTPGSHPSGDAMPDQDARSPAIPSNHASHGLFAQLFVTACPALRLLRLGALAVHEVWSPFFASAFSTVRGPRERIFSVATYTEIPADQLLQQNMEMLEALDIGKLWNGTPLPVAQVQCSE